MGFKPTILAVAACLLVSVASASEPDRPVRLSEFPSWSSLLTEAEPAHLRTPHGLVPILQEIPDEWGWGGGMDKSSGSGPSTVPKESEEKPNPLEVPDERLESIRDVEEEGIKPEPKIPDVFDLMKTASPAKKTRIGPRV